MNVTRLWPSGGKLWLLWMCRPPPLQKLNPSHSSFPQKAPAASLSDLLSTDSWRCLLLEIKVQFLRRGAIEKVMPFSDQREFPTSKALRLFASHFPEFYGVRQ